MEIWRQKGSIALVESMCIGQNHMYFLFQVRASRAGDDSNDRPPTEREGSNPKEYEYYVKVYYDFRDERNVKRRKLIIERWLTIEEVQGLCGVMFCLGNIGKSVAELKQNIEPYLYELEKQHGHFMPQAGSDFQVFTDEDGTERIDICSDLVHSVNEYSKGFAFEMFTEGNGREHPDVFWKHVDGIQDHIRDTLDKYCCQTQRNITGWLVGVMPVDPWIDDTPIDPTDASGWNKYSIISRARRYRVGDEGSYRKYPNILHPDIVIIVACITDDTVPRPWKTWGFTHREYAHFLEYSLHCCGADKTPFGDAFIPTKRFGDELPRSATLIYVPVQLADKRIY